MNNRPKQYPPELVEAVRNLYWEHGLGVREVADRLDVSFKVVHRLMINHNIERRGSGEKARPDAQPAVPFRNGMAYCAPMDPDIFFPTSDGDGAFADRARATAICRNHCLVMEGCLRHALQIREEFGVWGGCTESERERIAMQWDRRSPLVVECESCERGFVPLIDGNGTECAGCRKEAVA